MSMTSIPILRAACVTGVAKSGNCPLPPAVWVIVDRAGVLAPIGLVAGRFDEVIEVFQLGQWLNVTFTKQYEEWLGATEKPLALTAPFADLSPGLIAEMRIGNHRFELAELYEAGFQALTNPPKFDFNGRMQPLEGQKMSPPSLSVFSHSKGVHRNWTTISRPSLPASAQSVAERQRRLFSTCLSILPRTSLWVAAA